MKKLFIMITLPVIITIIIHIIVIMVLIPFLHIRGSGLACGIPFITMDSIILTGVTMVATMEVIMVAIMVAIIRVVMDGVWSPGDS